MINTFIIFISILSILLIYLLHISMFQWTEKLKKENCDCSDLWHRKYINVIALFLIIVITINLILIYLKINNSFINIFRIILGIIQISYYIIIIDYIRKLKIKDCNCSENWKREYGFIFTIIIVSFLSLILISSFITLLFFKK
jgi:uncharacterized membrane protein